MVEIVLPIENLKALVAAVDATKQTTSETVKTRDGAPVKLTVLPAVVTGGGDPLVPSNEVEGGDPNA